MAAQAAESELVDGDRVQGTFCEVPSMVSSPFSSSFCASGSSTSASAGSASAICCACRRPHQRYQPALGRRHGGRSSGGSGGGVGHIFRFFESAVGGARDENALPERCERAPRPVAWQPSPVALALPVHRTQRTHSTRGRDFSTYRIVHGIVQPSDSRDSLQVHCTAVSVSVSPPSSTCHDTIGACCAQQRLCTRMRMRLAGGRRRTSNTYATE